MEESDEASLAMARRGRRDRITGLGERRDVLRRSERQ
jgi:hypothetical protein